MQRWLSHASRLVVAVALAGIAVAAGSRDAGAALNPNDPQYPQQWNLAAVRAPEAWAVTTGSAAVRVAVVDTGIVSSGELQGQVAPGFNAITGGSAEDDYGSYGAGTRAGSVIGARTNNGQFMAGVAWNITLVPVKVCNATGLCLASDLAEGITWAVNNDVDIININVSLGVANAAVDAAVADAVNRGVLIVASGGNSMAAVSYPATLPGVIAVGSTNAADAVASFSPRGAQLDITAPGEGVLTAVRSGCCLVGSGSSLAAAHVAGALALLISAGIPANEATAHVLQSAADLGAPGWDAEYGWGRLDICDAFARAGYVCGGEPWCVDLSGEGRIDLIDVLMALDQYGDRGTGIAADVNDDGIVSLEDALLLLDCM